MIWKIVFASARERIGEKNKVYVEIQDKDVYGILKGVMTGFFLVW